MANEPKPSTEKKTSKTEMVRQAIKVGKLRKPTEIQTWVQEKFGTTIDVTHISTIKSNLKKKKGTRTRSTSTEGGEETAAPRRKRESGDKASLSFEEMRVVKELVERMGQEKVKEAVDLLG